jgi:hypothetical protein
MSRWERRENKLEKKRNRMRVSGKSVFTIRDIINKRARRKNARKSII